MSTTKLQKKEQQRRGNAPQSAISGSRITARADAATMPIYGKEPAARADANPMPLYGKETTARADANPMPLYGTETAARADAPLSGTVTTARVDAPISGTVTTARADTDTLYQPQDYVPGEAVTQAQQALTQLQGQKPGDYVSQYESGLKDLMEQISGRPGFQYDVNADALYQLSAQNYLAQGRQAMMDTMGQAAALTGGYASSYAQTAGQQQYNRHLQGLTDLIPQFQQMALEQYRMEGDRLMDQYDLMLQQEQSAYGRYQDAVSRYYADLDRLQSAYDSARDYDYSRFSDQRDFDYGKYLDEMNHRYRTDRDKVADEQWLQQWQYQQERDRIQDQQWLREFEEKQRQYNERLAWEQAQAAARAARSSGGGGSSSAYRNMAAELEEGGLSSAEMLKKIRQSDLSESQQDKLVDKYQKPQQKQEVLKRDPSKDTSAYWSMR